MMDQYDLASLVLIFISEQYFEYVFSCSLFITDGFAQCFFESFDLQICRNFRSYPFWFPIINLYSSIEYVIAEYIFYSFTKTTNIFIYRSVRKSSFPLKIYYCFLNNFYISTFIVPDISIKWWGKGILKLIFPKIRLWRHALLSVGSTPKSVIKFVL